ncbi:MAG: glycosyltransferase family 2 protein [Kiritimatiellae bacterium]|nr:glycosyltransferase family 2 protein [Kiritimatiellia bacterium]
MNAERKISVVTPVFRREDVFKTVAFLEAQPFWPRLRMVVVDNGNPPELSARLRALEAKGIDVVSLAENRGGSGAYFAGMDHAMRAHADTDLVWLLDDDAEPNARTLPALLEVYAERSAESGRVAAVVSTIVSRQHPGIVVETGAIAAPGKKSVFPNRGAKIAELPDEDVEVVYGAAASMLVAKECVRECGFFENLFIHFDDIEWGYRVTQKRGWKIFATTRSAVVHPEFKGVSKSGAWVSYYDARNEFWFCRKHAPDRLPAMLRRAAIHRFILRLHGDEVVLPYLRLAAVDFRSGRLRLRSELPDLSFPSEVDWTTLDARGGAVALACYGRKTLAFVRSRLPHCKVKALVYEIDSTQPVSVFLRRYLLAHLSFQLFCWLHPSVPVLFDYSFIRHRMFPLLFTGRINVAFEYLVPECFPGDGKWMSFPWDVCAEFDAVRARLRADPDAWAAGKDDYLRKRFAAYEERLAQLSGAERRAFRLRFGRELRRSIRLGVLELSAFSPAERKRIRGYVRAATGLPERIASAFRFLPGSLRAAGADVAARVWTVVRSTARRIRG